MPILIPQILIIKAIPEIQETTETQEIPELLVVSTIQVIQEQTILLSQAALYLELIQEKQMETTEKQIMYQNTNPIQVALLLM